DEDPAVIIDKITEYLNLKKNSYDALLSEFKYKEPEMLELEKLYDNSKIVSSKDYPMITSKIEEYKKLLLDIEEENKILYQIKLLEDNLSFHKLRDIPELPNNSLELEEKYK